MPNLQRMRVHWTGFSGAPGVNTLWFDDTSPADPAPAMRTFFEAIKAHLAQGVTIAYDNTGDLVSDATGAITGSWSGTAAANTSSTGAGVYAAPVGACVTMRTASIINRRRLIGKMFLVPLDADSFDTTGRLNSTALSDINNAMATFLASAPGGAWSVWHRPKNGSGGSSSHVISAKATDLPATLRSRRD